MTKTLINGVDKNESMKAYFQCFHGIQFIKSVVDECTGQGCC